MTEDNMLDTLDTTIGKKRKQTEDSGEYSFTAGLPDWAVPPSDLYNDTFADIFQNSELESIDSTFLQDEFFFSSSPSSSSSSSSSISGVYRLCSSPSLFSPSISNMPLTSPISLSPLPNTCNLSLSPAQTPLSLRAQSTSKKITKKQRTLKKSPLKQTRPSPFKIFKEAVCSCLTIKIETAIRFFKNKLSEDRNHYMYDILNNRLNFINLANKMTSLGMQSYSPDAKTPLISAPKMFVEERAHKATVRNRLQKRLEEELKCKLKLEQEGYRCSSSCDAGRTISTIELHIQLIDTTMLLYDLQEIYETSNLQPGSFPRLQTSTSYTTNTPSLSSKNKTKPKKNGKNVFSKAISSTSEKVIRDAIDFLSKNEQTEYQLKCDILQNRLEFIKLARKISALGKKKSYSPDAANPLISMPKMFLKEREKFGKNRHELQITLDQQQQGIDGSNRKAIEKEIAILRDRIKVVDTSILLLDLMEIYQTSRSDNTIDLTEEAPSRTKSNPSTTNVSTAFSSTSFSSPVTSTEDSIGDTLLFQFGTENRQKPLSTTNPSNNTNYRPTAFSTNYRG